MDKQKIVLISGFGGTGKTAVGARLHDLLDNNALVEADELFHIKPFLIDDKMGRVKLHNTLDVIRNFLQEEYPYVICIGLVWSQNELDAVLQTFPADSYEHFLFWLHAAKPVRFQRVLQRAEAGDTLEWLEHIEQTIIDPWPFDMSSGKALAIDTTHISSDQTAAEIVKLIR